MRANACEEVSAKQQQQSDEKTQQQQGTTTTEQDRMGRIGRMTANPLTFALILPILPILPRSVVVVVVQAGRRGEAEAAMANVFALGPPSPSSQATAISSRIVR